jgi:hypothetical protein
LVLAYKSAVIPLKVPLRTISTTGFASGVEHGEGETPRTASAGFSIKVAEQERTSTIKHVLKAVSAVIVSRRFMIVVSFNVLYWLVCSGLPDHRAHYKINAEVI